MMTMMMTTMMTMMMIMFFLHSTVLICEAQCMKRLQ